MIEENFCPKLVQNERGRCQLLADLTWSGFLFLVKKPLVSVKNMPCSIKLANVQIKKCNKLFIAFAWW